MEWTRSCAIYSRQSGVKKLMVQVGLSLGVINHSGCLGFLKSSRSEAFYFLVKIQAIL